MADTINAAYLDIQYLKHEKIGKVIAQGLADVYRQKPKFPIDYLAKWLLNYCKTEERHQHVETTIKEKEEKERQNIIELERQQEDEQIKQLEQARDQEVESSFKSQIVDCAYHEELLISDFCEFIEKRKKLTGVYIGVQDFPRKNLNEEDDEELAHLDQAQPKLINYIGASSSHIQIMTGKTLSLESGITPEAFKEPELVPDENGVLPERQPYYVYVSDVLKEPRMIYYNWPKLGCYMAVPLAVNSCLFDGALDAGVDERQKFSQAKEDQLKGWEAQDADYTEKLKAIVETGEDPAPIQAEWDQIKSERAEVQEASFLTQKKDYVVCLDTLGQDRELKKDDQKYIYDYVKLFQQSWEKKERDILSEDINKQLHYLETVGNVKDQADKFYNQEESAADPSAFPDLKDKERELNYELECQKLEKVKEHLQDAQVQTYFLGLTDFRVIKYKGIFQALLFFLGYKKENINIPKTNILNWKKCSKLFDQPLIDRMLAYNHRGAKHDQIQPYAKINRLTKLLEKYDVGTVDNYNLGLGRVLKFLQLTMKLRKQDIEIRKMKIEAHKQLREQKIAETEKLKEDKVTSLEAFKATIPPEEIENFNEEEWNVTWSQDHPFPDIPENIQFDIDEDLDEVQAQQ